MTELSPDALLYLCADRFVRAAPPDAPPEQTHVVPGTSTRVGHRDLIIETYVVSLWDRRAQGEVSLTPGPDGVVVAMPTGGIRPRRHGTPTSAPYDPKKTFGQKFIVGGDPTVGQRRREQCVVRWLGCSA